MEEKEEIGRRTRSGRVISTSASDSAESTQTGKAVRKSTRQTHEVLEAIDTPSNLEAVNDSNEFEQSDIIKEMLAEAAQGANLNTNKKESLSQENMEQSQFEPAIISDTLSQIAEDVEMLEKNIQIRQNEEKSMENRLLANMKKQQSLNDEMEISKEIEAYEVEIPISGDEEKSSSFPFGISDNVDNVNSENSEGDTNNGVNSSLLATLAGDNANSLPSAGEESQPKDNFEKIATSISETIKNNNGENENIAGMNVDAEMVSEDELPMPVKPKINDAEEVSDDELPAPKRAELPADAEVVSEDELPTPKRAEIPADTDSLSDDDLPKIQSENDKTPEKNKKGEKDITIDEKPEKIEVDKEVSVSHKSPKKRKKEDEVDKSSGESKNVEKKPKLEENKDGESEEKRRKKLPDLDKYWKAVRDDASDFTGWTYLLQYVDQETDVEAAREAYDSFLAHYPYCYGYWRKYADYEKRKGDKTKTEEVCLRGLKAIPLSVDLWIYYISYVKASYVDNDERIREQYEKAIHACGLEYRSDKLWDSYINWESESKRYNKVLAIYDRLLAVPTQGYSKHFNNFQDLINNQSPSLTVTAEEFRKIRSEVRENLNKSSQKKEKDNKEDKKSEKEVAPGGEGDENHEILKSKDTEAEISLTPPPPEADFDVKNDDELAAIKDRIIAIRRKIHKQTVSAVTARWTFEEGIKRPYFHVKPLEKCQLKNWKEYLDFEIEKGDMRRILILFERCLIACALYDDFWLKLIRYLESHNKPDLENETRSAYQRACEIHHPEKPNLHLMWSAFEEQHDNINKAADILEKLEKVCPNLLQIAYRRINIERRRGNLDKCIELYKHYIAEVKDKKIAGSLAIKFARFYHKILKDLDSALKVLKDVLLKDCSNTRVALHLIDMTLQRDVINEHEIIEIMDSFMARDNIEPEQKILFAQRKVEFLEDFGSTSKGLQDAQRALQTLLEKAGENKKKSEESKKSSKDSQSASTATQAVAYNASNNYNYNANYYNSAQQAYQQSYDYNHWQYNNSSAAAGYNNYGQWSGGGYGNYY